MPYRMADTFKLDNTITEEKQTDIRASSWIRTHDYTVWATENITHLTPCGHCDVHILQFWVQLIRFYLKTEPECSLRNVVFQIKDRKLDNVQNCGCYTIITNL
jgi:cytidine deaminase